MGKPDFPAFMRNATAARFCDMKTSEFNALVARGALPAPGPLGRWDRESLAAVLRGDNTKPKDEFDL
ncbi:hypothetical protein [Thioclava sp. GXIMD2076]|uniref:hypothetical protein n=1 Tax=Thioclava sp. GXIMD2076 TaxID=3131931 RepID=UPI0030D1B9AB